VAEREAKNTAKGVKLSENEREREREREDRTTE